MDDHACLVKNKGSVCTYRPIDGQLNAPRNLDAVDLCSARLFLVSLNTFLTTVVKRPRVSSESEGMRDEVRKMLPEHSRVHNCIPL